MKTAVLSFPAEVRATEDTESGKRKITGMAAVFGQLSEDLGGFREKIAPGAFGKTLREKSVKKAYWNHNSDRVLGSTKAGTLKLREMDEGLWFEIDPPSWADEHLESIERGDVDQMSFGFRTPAGKDRWFKDDAGKVIRELTEVQLFEVSPVSMPAYPQTDAQVRSVDTGRLQELMVQADHDLLDDDGRAELRGLLAELNERSEPNHSEEPEPETENHSAEPEVDESVQQAKRKAEDRLKVLGAAIGGKYD